MKASRRDILRKESLRFQVHTQNTMHASSSISEIQTLGRPSICGRVGAGTC